MPKEYAEMTSNEVYEFLNAKLPQKANVCEIGCGPKSGIALRNLMDAGRINSYQGYDVDQKAVDATKKASGLEVEVVSMDHNHIPGFKAVAAQGNGVLVMMGLPEVAREAAEVYAQQAKEQGLYVVSYPEL